MSSLSSSSPPMTTPPGRAPPPWRPTSTAVWRNRSSPTGRPSGAPASRPWIACLVSSTPSRSSRPRRTSGSRSSREWRRARRTPRRPPSGSSESSRGGPRVDTTPPRSASISIRNTRGTCTSAGNSPGTMRSKGDHDQEDEMRTRFLALGLTFLGAQVLGAQTKLSGAGTCGKPDVTHTIAIGDRPNHSFTISQIKGGAGVQSDEVSDSTSQFHGYFLDTMSDGNQAHYRYVGTTTLKDGALQSAIWNWLFVGGTGTLRGLRGSGSCRAKSIGNGVSAWECTGSYQLPK